MGRCINYSKSLILCYVGEKMKNQIEDEDGKVLAVNAMESCWKYIEGEDVDANVFCNYMDNEEQDDFITYSSMAESEKECYAFDTLQCVVSYIAVEASRGVYSFLPQYLEGVDDEFYADVMETVISLGFEGCSQEELAKVEQFIQSILKENEEYLFTKVEILNCVK